MKQIILLLSVLFITKQAFTQDIITKKSGEVIKAKIIFTDDIAIKYKKYEDQNGVQYLLLLKDIRTVVKEDGTTIVGTSFSASNTPVASSTNPTPTTPNTTKPVEISTNNTTTSPSTSQASSTSISTSTSTTPTYDIIFKKTGEEIKAKVIAVNPSNIVYKKQENLTGPDYTIYSDEVMMIKYKNGTNEVIQTPTTPKTLTTENTTTSNTTNENGYTKFEAGKKTSSNNETTFTYSAAKNVFENHESEIRIFAAMGIKPLRTPFQTIEFEYEDESPSRDYIYENFDVRKNIYSGSFRLGLAYQLKQNVFFKGLFDFYFGRIGGVSFDFGAGYSFEFNKFKLRPQVLFSFGYSSIKLGDIQQNDLYIKVNSTYFYSPSVAVKLRSNQVLFTPQIELAYKVSNRIELDLDLGYNLALSKGVPYTFFYGQDNEDNNVSAKESININNMYLGVDGNRLKTQNIKFGYPTVHVGMSFCFNK